MLDDGRPMTAAYVIACMRQTFEHRVAIYGEFPEYVPPTLPAGYAKALEAQKQAKAQEKLS